jgi:16S rRNA (cytidine1402-2'-O)-methyltransferase
MPLATGILYVVATPIGNLADFSDRARQVLTTVDVIAAEDTRDTRHLLTHFGITATLLAYHDHNERSVAPRVLALLDSGRSVALVSDAGTPLISDPGYNVVAAARERGLTVVPVPGASAAICALSAAGLASDRFLFLGFPPRSAGQRRTWLAAVVNEPGTLIIYESTKRMLATLADIETELGATRRVVLARELTKRFETFLSGTAAELSAHVTADPEQQRGELVILVAGCPAPVATAVSAEATRMLTILAAALPLRQAVELTAQVTGAKKNALYQLGLITNQSE